MNMRVKMSKKSEIGEISECETRWLQRSFLNLFNGSGSGSF